MGAEAIPNPGQPAVENKSTDQAQPPGQQTPAAGTTGVDLTKDAAKEAMRKFKVKVDDKEIEVDEAELLKGYTHGKAAAKRFQEGSRAKAQAEQFIKLMQEGQKDPAKLQEVLYKMGYTRQQIREISEKVLAAEIEEDLMDPKDKELKTTKQKLAAYEAEKAKHAEETKQQEHDRLKARYAKEYSEQFIEALKKTGLPQTKPMVALMAGYIKRAADIGYKITADEAAKLVHEDEQKRIQSIVGGSEADILAKLLGEDTLQKLRAYETQRVKDPNSQLNTPKDQADEVRRKRDGTTRMTPQEWRAFNRK